MNLVRPQGFSPGAFLWYTINRVGGSVPDAPKAPPVIASLDHLPAMRGGFHAGKARAKRLLTKWGAGRVYEA